MIRLLFCILALATPALANDAVGRVNVAGYKALSMCSGTLVAPDKVLTAAHCVINLETGAVLPLADIVFVAGWNGEDYAGAAQARSVAVHPNALKDGQLQLGHDLAVITLQDPLDLPPLGLGQRSDGPFALMGYKRSRPHRLDSQEGCVLVGEGPIWQLACAVEPGQSGGPVLADNKVAAVLVAIRITKAGPEALAVPLDAWTRDAI